MQSEQRDYSRCRERRENRKEKKKNEKPNSILILDNNISQFTIDESKFSTTLFFVGIHFYFLFIFQCLFIINPISLYLALVLI